MLPGQVETYPLTDPSFLEDPYPFYRRMRQQDPVYWSDALGSWVLTRHDDVLAATRHPALSSARTEVFVRAQLRGSDPALAADYTRITRGNAADFDGWVDEGAPGWSYREMLPYFIRSERNERGDVRANINAAVIAIAEKASDILLRNRPAEAP